jgi:hypothetical protein
MNDELLAEHYERAMEQLKRNARQREESFLEIIESLRAEIMSAREQADAIDGLRLELEEKSVLVQEQEHRIGELEAEVLQLSHDLYAMSNEKKKSDCEFLENTSALRSELQRSKDQVAVLQVKLKQTDGLRAVTGELADARCELNRVQMWSGTLCRRISNTFLEAAVLFGNTLCEIHGQFLQRLSMDLASHAPNATLQRELMGTLERCRVELELLEDQQRRVTDSGTKRALAVLMEWQEGERSLLMEKEAESRGRVIAQRVSLEESSYRRGFKRPILEDLRSTVRDVQCPSNVDVDQVVRVVLPLAVLVLPDDLMKACVVDRVREYADGTSTLEHTAQSIVGSVWHYLAFR